VSANFKIFMPVDAFFLKNIFVYHGNIKIFTDKTRTQKSKEKFREKKHSIHRGTASCDVMTKRQ
jgi:hypothetical protein